MKQGSSQQRRGRSRGNGSRRSNSPNRNSSMESNGPDGKVRGNAQQILDKYQSLARDASLAGEHIAAEGYFQYAEHYQRVLTADAANNPNPNRNQNQRDDNKSSGDGADNQKPQDTDKVTNSDQADPEASAADVVKVAEPDVAEPEAATEDAVDDAELAASA